MSIDETTLPIDIARIQELLDARRQELLKLKSEYQDRRTEQSEKIKSITLRGIRNYRNTTSIPLNSVLTLIYAANGVGKTSLVDAIELLTEGETSRAEYQKSPKTETKDQKVLPSLGCNYQDIRIVAHSFNDQTWTFENGSNQDVEHCPIDVISKRTLRSKVDGSATDRFNFLASLLPESRFQEDIEDISDLIADAAGTLKTLDSECKNIEDTLSEFNISSASISPELLHPSTNPSDKDTIIRRGIVKLKSYQDELDKLHKDIHSMEPVATPESRHPEAPTPPSARSEKIAILEDIAAHLRPGEICPVCDSSDITQHRIEEINDIIQDQQDYLAKLKKYQDAQSTVDSWMRFWNQFSDWAKSAVETFERINESSTDYAKIPSAAHREISESLEFCTDAVHSFENNEDINQVQDQTVALNEATTFISLLSRELVGLGKILEDILSSDATQREYALNKAWTWLGSTSEKVAKGISVINERSNYREQISKAKIDLTSLRNEFISSMFGPIEEDIISWWERIRPSSAHDIAIYFDIPNSKSAKTNRIEILCSIGAGEKLPALGILSESQLDALAISVRLAAHERLFGNNLLWLDDLTDSMDAMSSSEFVSELVKYAIERESQLAIVTHDHRVLDKVWEKTAAEGKTRFSESAFLSQVDLDLEIDDSGNTYARTSPHDWISARKRYKKLLEQSHEDPNENRRWSISYRLKLANTLRIYAEYLFADCHDALLCMVSGNSALLGSSAADRNSTLGPYTISLISAAKQVSDVLDQVSMSDGQRRYFYTQLDDVLDCAASMESSILNSGSHASARIPTFQEVSVLGDQLERSFRITEADGEVYFLKDFSDISNGLENPESWASARNSVRRGLLMNIRLLLNNYKDSISSTSHHHSGACNQ